MIELDGYEFKNKCLSFSYLNEKFDFEYEVNNLDALFDCLGMENSHIVIRNYRKIYDYLDEYGEKMLTCFFKAVLEFDLEIDFIY